MGAWGSAQTRTSTAAHKRWAQAVKRNARGRCQIQLAGCTGRADEADHIIPVAEGGDEFDLANGQGACSHCHGLKTREEARRGRARSYGRAKHRVERHPDKPKASNS